MKELITVSMGQLIESLVITKPPETIEDINIFLTTLRNKSINIEDLEGYKTSVIDLYSNIDLTNSYVILLLLSPVIFPKSTPIPVIWARVIVLLTLEFVTIAPVLSLLFSLKDSEKPMPSIYTDVILLQFTDDSYNTPPAVLAIDKDTSVHFHLEINPSTGTLGILNCSELHDKLDDDIFAEDFDTTNATIN